MGEDLIQKYHHCNIHNQYFTIKFNFIKSLQNYYLRYLILYLFCYYQIKYYLVCFFL